MKINTCKSKVLNILYLHMRPMGKIVFQSNSSTLWQKKTKTKKNQEVHGPQHSLEKPVQINTQICSMLWLYHNIDLEREKPIISFLICEWSFNLWNLQSPSPKDALCQVWFKLAKWFWRRRSLNFGNVFLLFRDYLPFEHDMTHFKCIWNVPYLFIYLKEIAMCSK